MQIDNTLIYYISSNILQMYNFFANINKTLKIYLNFNFVPYI